MNYLLGIDVGTTSMKGILIDENGKTICLVSESYNLITQSKFEVEIDAYSYWEAFKRIVKSVINLSRINAESIRGIAVDSQGETLICVDKNGEPLRNAIVWLDNRSTQEALEIKYKFGTKEICNITGQPEVVATWPATKILWLKKDEKYLFQKINKYLLVSDYINYKLSGKFITDRSLISSTLYFDIHKNEWWKDMLNYLGITDNQLPYIESSGTQIGCLTDKASIETGLSPDTIVVTGALDQIAGAIGAGNIHSDVVSESTGTCLSMCLNTKNSISYNHKYKIPCHCNALPGEYSLLFWSQTAGVILEWYKDNFYLNDNSKYSRNSKDEIYKQIDYEAAKINPGCDGLLMLPHFSGLAVPHFNPNAKGVFFGVGLNHTKAHFSRAIMEAVAFMLREHVETAESFGTGINEIRSLGGGAKSFLWNQIKADITGKEIVTLDNSETASLGAAILAGIGTGIFKDFQDACNKCIKIKQKYYPNISNKHIYNVSYEKYKSLYNSICHLY